MYRQCGIRIAHCRNITARRDPYGSRYAHIVLPMAQKRYQHADVRELKKVKIRNLLIFPPPHIFDWKCKTYVYLRVSDKAITIWRYNRNIITEKATDLLTDVTHGLGGSVKNRHRPAVKRQFAGDWLNYCVTSDSNSNTILACRNQKLNYWKILWNN